MEIIYECTINVLLFIWRVIYNSLAAYCPCNICDIPKAATKWMHLFKIKLGVFLHEICVVCCQGCVQCILPSAFNTFLYCGWVFTMVMSLQYHITGTGDTQIYVLKYYKTFLYIDIYLSFLIFSIWIKIKNKNKQKTEIAHNHYCWASVFCQPSKGKIIRCWL